MARTVAGWLLALMLALAIASTLWTTIPTSWAAMAAWLAALGLWSRSSRAQRWQVALLAVLGALGLGWGHLHGVPVDPLRVLSHNQLIISMMAAVTLLRLLNRPSDAGQPELPKGGGAYARSMLGVHLFGAVINYTAVVIMADRLTRKHPLTLSQGLLMSRAFTMAVFYSPFIGGMALALAYTPGSRLPTVMLFGVPLALVGFVAIQLLARRRGDQSLDEFRGYPVQFDSLWLPAGLAAAVLVLHTLFPDISVLSVIMLLSPAVVALVLSVRSGPVGAGRELNEFISCRLPEMSGELWLFLSAGVLAAGLAAVFASLGGWMPFQAFDAGAASLILISTVVVAFLGVHPVVVVSTAVPLLAPLDPDPSLMALLFVMGWGIGCAISPLSGTNVMLHGRYGVSNWVISRNNAGFCSIMTITAIGLLHLYESLFL